MTIYEKPEVIPAWAEGGDKNDVPTNPNIQEGWPASNTPPTRQRFNWLLNWLAVGARAWMQRGIPTWDSQEDYPQYAKVIYTDGKTYSAKVENSNLPPPDHPEAWERWGFSASDPNVDNVPTPPIWDNDSTVPNTEWVNRNGVYAPIKAVSDSYAVVASDTGSNIAYTGTASGKVITLPAIAQIPDGRTVTVSNWTSGIYPITVASDSRIDLFGVGSVSELSDASIAVYPGEVFCLQVWNGVWRSVWSNSRRVRGDSTLDTGNMAINKTQLEAALNSQLCGSLILYPSTAAVMPTRTLIANGAAVSRTTYADLFNRITYSSEGSTIGGTNQLILNDLAVLQKLYNGCPISGPGIPAGTTVVSVTPPNVTLSQNTTSSNTGTYVVAPWGAGDGVSTFNLPEFRGEFIRGLDFGRGVDAGRGLGVAQLDAFQGHYHNLESSSGGTTGINRIDNGAFNEGGPNYGTLAGQRAGAIGSNTTYGTVRVASETRPRNRAALVLIRY